MFLHIKSERLNISFFLLKNNYINLIFLFYNIEICFNGNNRKKNTFSFYEI